MQEIPWSFRSESFDIIYAHLSLHYFDEKTTNLIFDEIYRILKHEGIFAFFTNSKDDPEYDKNLEIEDGFLKIGEINKRFFDEEMAKRFAKKFEIIICDNKGETYKDSAKGIHNLIRYIGSKKSKNII